MTGDRQLAEDLLQTALAVPGAITTYDHQQLRRAGMNILRNSRDHAPQVDMVRPEADRSGLIGEATAVAGLEALGVGHRTHRHPGAHDSRQPDREEVRAVSMSRRSVPAYVAVVLLLSGCGATTATEAGDGTTSGPETTPAAPAETTAESAGPSPPTRCEPIRDVGDIEDLVIGGATVAVASIDITGAPGPVEFGTTRLVPVHSARLLAGFLTNGAPTQIEESVGIEEETSLPPGEYVVMLGSGTGAGDYFMSDGVRGSFVRVGVNAYRRCPDYSDPGTTQVLRTGITDLNALTPMFVRAIRSVGR